MWRKFDRFIEKIQNSDETVKRRWLIGASAVSMIFIIILWLFYISFIIKPATEGVAPSPADEFWPILQNGLTIVWAELTKLANQAWNSIWSQIKNVISIIIRVIMRERTVTF